MNKRRLIILNIFLVTILFTVGGYSQIQLLVSPDTNKMLLGDQQNLHLSVTADTSIHSLELILDSVKSIAGLELMGMTDWTDKNMEGSHVMSREIKFTVFNPGTVSFPAIPYQYTYKGQSKVGYSKPFEITVLPLTTNTEDIENIKDIITEKKNFWDYIWWIISGLALLIIIYSIYRFLKRPKKQKSVAQKTTRIASEVALEELQKLRDSGRWASDDHKGYQYALTEIIRQYLFAQFRIPFSLTTNEVIQKLSQQDWPQDTVKIIDESFNIADLVKFANAASRAEINHSYINKLEDIVRMTSTPEFNRLNRMA